MKYKNKKSSRWLKNSLKKQGKKIIIRKGRPEITQTTTNTTATTASGRLTLTALIQVFEEKNEKKRRDI